MSKSGKLNKRKKGKKKKNYKKLKPAAAQWSKCAGRVMFAVASIGRLWPPAADKSSLVKISLSLYL